MQLGQQRQSVLRIWVAIVVEDLLKFGLYGIKGSLSEMRVSESLFDVLKNSLSS